MKMGSAFAVVVCGGRTQKCVKNSQELPISSNQEKNNTIAGPQSSAAVITYALMSGPKHVWE
jgi:hypothetical protein